MRNLVQYSVDRTEVIILLDGMIAECDHELIGDMRPVILAALRLLVADRFNEPDIRKYFLIEGA